MAESKCKLFIDFVWKAIIGLSLLFLPFRPAPVAATSTYLFHPGFGTPTIDGNIEMDEWADADTYSQVMANSSLSGTLSILQDNSHLYFSFMIDDDELTTGYWYGLLGDTLEVFFDDNNSGVLFEINENKIVMNPIEQYSDRHFINGFGSSAEDTTQLGGQTNGEGRVSRQGSENHF